MEMKRVEKNMIEYPKLKEVNNKTNIIKNFPN